jgi:DNA-binding HxlR family transcriptional regulator/putative sterol carrier protein
MTGRRKYDDGCAIAHGLDLVGERWALLVVRELLLGPKRFTDLRAGLPGASPDVLSQRLRELQDAGVLTRRKLPPPGASWVYELTEWGADLEPVITQIAHWSSRSATLRHDAPIGVDSLLLSLKALFDPHAAEGFSATITLRLGEQDFCIQLTDEHLEVTRGRPGQPDVTLATDTATLHALLRGNRRLTETLTAGELRLAGDRSTAERFLALFPLPTPAIRAR